MIISEKQIMQLMAYTSCLLSRICGEHGPIHTINEISSLIDQIASQQSEELHELKE